MIGRDGVIRAFIVALFVVALELACRFGMISKFTIIPPSQMFASLLDILSSKAELSQIGTSLLNIFVAALLTTIIGFFLGIGVHAVPRLRAALDPLMVSYNALPLFAFYPLFILILGVGSPPIILMGVLLGLPSMMLATMNGLDCLPPVLSKVGSVYHMSPMSQALRLKLPAAAPYLFNGIRLAIAYAFIGVIASEFILSGSGIGFGVGFAYNSFDTRTMYGLILLVVILVAVINTLLHVWDRRLESRRTR